VDFGIRTPAHLGALRYALVSDGVTAAEFDAALGKCEEIQKLISGHNPYRYVSFRTDWDELTNEPDEDDYEQTEDMTTHNVEKDKEFVLSSSFQTAGRPMDEETGETPRSVEEEEQALRERIQQLRLDLLV
jgi:hypothetical protein